MSFLKKLSKVGNIGGTQLDKSDMFKNMERIVTPVPILNLAFSGSLDAGFGSGLHILAGPSKHYKSNLGLVMLKAFQDQYPESVVLFYDSEQGATSEYFDSFGIDQERVLHIPVMNIEELKFDISQKLAEIDKESVEAVKNKEEPPRVFIFIDSLGNLASKKEVEDALNDKSVADMTRAKAGKSLWRIVTPYLKKLKIPAVCIQHSYQTMELYSKTIIGGGTGTLYSADSAYVMGKRQVKGKEGLEGWEFVLNTDKSRYVREKSAFPIKVLYNGGISKYSGLLELGLATGYVTKPKQGWYTRPSVENDKNWRESETESAEFWESLLSNEDFKNKVSSMFKLSSNLPTFDEKMLDNIESTIIDEETGEVTSGSVFDQVED